MARRPKKEKRIGAKTIYTRESLGYDHLAITTNTDEFEFPCFVDPV